MLLGEDGVIEYVGKDSVYCPVPVPGLLEVIQAPEACTFLGESMHRLGYKNTEGL
jgi:hypothetical protein